MAIKETSYEVAVQDFKMNLFFRISKLDSLESVDIKFLPGEARHNKIYAIHTDMRIMIMLENDTIVTMYPIEKIVSCKGCGA